MGKDSVLIYLNVVGQEFRMQMSGNMNICSTSAKGFAVSAYFSDSDFHASCTSGL
jgi:hypothetical protein